MPHLDLNTIVFLLVLVTLLLAGLLAIASLHVGNIKGIKQWAIANACISIGFGISFTHQFTTHWALLIGIALLFLGQSLQYSGIQLFKYGSCNYKFPLLVTVLGILQTWLSDFVGHEVEIRAMLNSLLLALINGMCAKELLIRIQQPLRTAYWLSGTSFAVLCLLMLIRFINLLDHYPGQYTLFAEVPINYVAFFLCSITQLVISFGFVLMVNYTLASKLEAQVHIDELTGVLNRRALFEDAKKVCAQFMRSGNPISVLMLDIDHFKTINDHYGHPVGDGVLRRFANIARAEIRSGDFIGRYGGEEFCVVLPDTSMEEAQLLAERLRQHYADMVVAVVNNQPVHSTVSIGIADSQHASADFEMLIKAADHALLRAKAEGRNRVCIDEGAINNVSLASSPA